MRARFRGLGHPLRWFALHFIFGCVCILCSPRAAYAGTPTFTLQSIRGRVEIQAGGKGTWASVKRGVRKASPGDRIRTGTDGSVHVVTDEGARIAVGPKTEVVLREPERPRGLRVVIGKILAVFSKRRRLEVRAPAAVAAAEGTSFQLDVSEDGTTVLTVAEGEVQFFNDLGSVMVLSSQQSTARIGQAPTRPIVVDPSSLMAWEANTQTLILEIEHPHVSADPAQLEQELARRQEAVRQRPDDPAAHAALAEVLLDLARTDEAVAQARQAVDMAPDQATYRGALGHALLQAGRPAEAHEEFATASAADPANARWHVGLALVALAQRDASPAVGSLQRAADLAPDDPLPRAYLAAAYLRSGDLEKAAASASEAARLGPDDYLANTYLSYVRMAQGEIEQATAAASKAVGAAPQSALAHGALGAAFLFAGDYGNARRELEQALDLNPLSATSHLTLAKLMAAEGEIESALGQAQLAVGLNPQSAAAHSTLGLLFLLNKDPQRAGRQFRQALDADPTLSEARTGWGLVLLQRGRFREALDQQKAAVSLDTDSASAHNNLGGVYGSLGEMDLAIAHLTRAIELQPGWGMPYANLALVYLETNRYREALDAGERAVALGEASPFAHTVLARIYMRQGRTDRALAELRQAVALDEHYPQAQFQLAKLYLESNRSRDAVRAILTSVTVDPSAMLETRLYARTESVLSGGSDSRAHYDARHSGSASEGSLSYFGAVMLEGDDGFRTVNQDSMEKFAEIIAGYQPGSGRQMALLGTFFRRTSGLPGPETTTLSGDPDDRQQFTGYDAVLAHRQRISPDVTATLKYSYRDDHLRFRNPDSLTGDDSNPFSTLVNDSSRHSPEFRIDAGIGEAHTLSLGYGHLSDDRRLYGTAGTVDPGTGQIVYAPFSDRIAADTDTAWIEAMTRVRDDSDLVVGMYWGRETGASHILLPKVVAIHRPDRRTWWTFAASPIFRADALELASVEALADPRGLTYLDFTAGGAGRSYELRYQRQGSRSSTISFSLAHQRVRGLLVDVQDPAVTGLPTRVLIDRGYRWLTDVAYERWLGGAVTGRAWAQWQYTRGRVPQAQVDKTDWPYAPEWQAGGRLDYINEKGVRIGLEATWVGDRYHDPQNSQVVKGYPLVNLRFQYQRDLRRNYFVELLNLTDRDYETFDGFPQAGLTVAAGLEYRH